MIAEWGLQNYWHKGLHTKSTAWFTNVQGGPVTQLIGQIKMHTVNSIVTEMKRLRAVPFEHYNNSGVALWTDIAIGHELNMQNKN